MSAVVASAVAAAAVIGLGALVGAVATGGPRAVRVPVTGSAHRFQRRGRSRRSPDDTAMAEWCEHVARGVRTGASLRRAMHDASRTVPAAAPAVASVLNALERGVALGPALRDLDDDPSTATGLVVGVLGACAELGGPAARPLDRTAATLHARAAERAERDAASAQARLSARVLSFLPVGTMALLAVAEPSTRGALRTPLGLACVATGGACNLVGWWWMRRVIGRAP